MYFPFWDFFLLFSNFIKKKTFRSYDRTIDTNFIFENGEKITNKKEFVEVFTEISIFGFYLFFFSFSGWFHEIYAANLYRSENDKIGIQRIISVRILLYRFHIIYWTSFCHLKYTKNMLFRVQHEKITLETQKEKIQLCSAVRKNNWDYLLFGYFFNWT